MSSTNTALKLYWSQLKQIAKKNWKYAVAFAIGSFTSAVFTFFFTKSLTGWNTQELIGNIFIKSMEKKYRNIVDYNGFSVNPSPMRPSTSLITWDAIFRNKIFTFIKERDKTNISTDEEWRKIILEEREEFNSTRNMTKLSPFMPKAEEVIIKQSSFNNTGPIKGYIVKYPGATIENGMVLYIHGGAFVMGLSLNNFTFNFVT